MNLTKFVQSLLGEKGQYTNDAIYHLINLYFQYNPNKKPPFFPMGTDNRL